MENNFDTNSTPINQGATVTPAAVKKVTFADEAFKPLPNDLRLVTYRLIVWNEGEDDESCGEVKLDAEGVRALNRCFGSIGTILNVADAGAYDKKM
jgi:hypothetical protein